jgi:hypothetical protein
MTSLVLVPEYLSTRAKKSSGGYPDLRKCSGRYPSGLGRWVLPDSDYRDGQHVTDAPTLAWRCLVSQVARKLTQPVIDSLKYNDQDPVEHKSILC